MASLKQKIAKVIGREFITGKIYRVDMDRVDVLPNGSTGILRSLPLTGDRDKIKPGDEVKILTVAGERIALAGDVASALSEPQEVAALTEDQENLLSRLGEGGLGGSAPSVASEVTQGKYYVDDWRPLEGSAYASATSITIPKDVTSRLPKGIKIRITQSGAYKYFYGVGATYSSGTLLSTLNLTGGMDYTVANEAIEELCYSSIQSPQGFPEWFNFACSWTAATTNPVVGNAVGWSYFKIDGTLVTWSLYMFMGSTTTYGSGSWRFSLPVPALTDTHTICFFSMGKARDASTATYPLLLQLNSNSTYLTYFITTAAPATTVALSATSPFTWTSTDELGWTAQYRI